MRGWPRPADREGETAVKRVVTAATMQLVMRKYAPTPDVALRFLLAEIEDRIRKELCSPSSSQNN